MANRLFQAKNDKKNRPMKPLKINPDGNQRLSLSKLQAWENLKYGMFIHFGMSTFANCELPSGNDSVELYNPAALDVDQWIKTAKDAGMQYAVLTAKHVAGHCLWPSKLTEYSVKNSPVKTDVVEAFVNACSKHGVMPGLYYCSWDNHHRFGSRTPSDTVKSEQIYPGQQLSFTTSEYQDFQSSQLEELLTQYGKIGEIWIDIPGVLPRCYRQELYQQLSRLQPDAVIMMNSGCGDGSKYRVDKSWPSDLIAIERWLPNSKDGHIKWREIEGKAYYLPGEVCDPIGKEWFYLEGDEPRSDAELLGMYLVTRSRGANLLLDVPPNKRGVIPQTYADSLMRLRANIEKNENVF
ncbi:MAG: alpha-L-fucosidase [Lentisphaerae bacterium]|nr:alpha-L-fucosidase [Lentisphaerota bacterium]